MTVLNGFPASCRIRACFIIATTSACHETAATTAATTEAPTAATTAAATAATTAATAGTTEEAKLAINRLPLPHKTWEHLRHNLRGMLGTIN